MPKANPLVLSFLQIMQIVKLGLGCSRAKFIRLCISNKSVTKVAQNRCDPHFQKPANFLWISKILLIFKKAEVLPLRFPNFDKANNFVFLTIKLH